MLVECLVIATAVIYPLWLVRNMGVLRAPEPNAKQVANELREAGVYRKRAVGMIPYRAVTWSLAGFMLVLCAASLAPLWRVP